MPRDNLRLPACVVAVGVQLVASSWSDHRTNIGSRTPEPSGLVPKQNTKRLISDTRMRFCIVGMFDPVSSNALVTREVDASQ